MAKRKYNRGRQVDQRWVFGMYDVHRGIGILEFVDDRTQKTLLPIIQAILFLFFCNLQKNDSN